MSLLNVISKFKTGTYTVTRNSNTVVNGLAVAGTPSVFTIDASVQPESGADLVDNGEGKMVYTQLILWTATFLEIDSSTNPPDVISINGTNYRVSSSDKFSILSSHWRVVVQKVDVP